MGEAKIHYVDIGPCRKDDETALVFIHGASCHSSDMQLAFGEGQNQYRKIFLDRPGCGFSSSLANSSLQIQAEIICEFLNSLDVNKIVLVGQSYGGALALKIALQEKLPIEGMVLLAPVSHRWPGGVAWYNHLAVMPVIGHFFRYVIVPILGKHKGADIIENAFWPNQAPRNYYQNAMMSLFFRPKAFKNNCQSIVSLRDEVIQMEAEYHKLKMPIRIIAGSHDTAVLSTIHGFGLMEKADDCEMEFVQGVGHPVHHFAKEEVESAIAGILNSPNAE